MVIGVDETGTFKLKSGNEFGLVTLVTVTDQEWGSFQTFINTNFPKTFGQVKGSNISINQREKILKYIGKRSEIRYTAIIFDLNFGSARIVEAHKINQIVKIQDWIVNNLTNSQHTLIADMELLRNQIINLSTADYIKFFLVTMIFMHWQRFFQFDYLYTNISRDKWLMHHVIDTQTKPDRFMRLVKRTLALTTNYLNPNYGIYTPQGWKSTHPFIKNHSFNGQTALQDGKKFYADFKVGNEQDNHILFLPDLIGNTIYKSIVNTDDIVLLKLLKRIKQNRSIAMTKAGRINNYYILAGLSGTNSDVESNPIFQSHYIKMRDL